MLVLRLIIVLVALFLVFSGGMYVFTRNPRYLGIATQVLRLIVFLLLIFALLFILERYVLVGWKVLL